MCTEQTKILKEQQNFYQKLYSKDPAIEFKLVNETDKKISEAQKQRLNEKLEDKELEDAMHSLKNNKCPGSDGLSVEFYKSCWSSMKHLALPMFRETIEKGRLGTSARRGLMQLIPKKGKDCRYIKNMRPLMLLNVDYKILATAVASRLQSVLPDIIGEQQTGFMEGRSIHNNLRRTMDILNWVNDEYHRKETLTDDEYIIINLDFVKCFDMIEHKAVFGSAFIDMVKIFFKDFMVCTQNAGYTSTYFAKTRGINQGCPNIPLPIPSVWGGHDPHVDLEPQGQGHTPGGPKN